MPTGFWSGGDDITADGLNNTLTQFGVATDRPTASSDIEGVEWYSTDTNVRSQVQNGIWVDIETPIPDASFTERGIIRVSDQTTASARSNTDRAVPPAYVAAAVPDASTTVAGKVELATTTETGGNDDDIAVTPSGLSGSNYRVFRSGTADPDDSVGVDGDFYFRRS